MKFKILTLKKKIALRDLQKKLKENCKKFVNKRVLMILHFWINKFTSIANNL